MEKMKTSDNIQQLAQELELERKLLYTWKYHFEGRPEKNHADYLGKPAPDTVEVDCFAAALRRVKRDRQASGVHGDPASTRKSANRPMRKAN